MNKTHQGIIFFVVTTLAFWLPFAYVTSNNILPKDDVGLSLTIGCFIVYMIIKYIFGWNYFFKRETIKKEKTFK